MTEVRRKLVLFDCDGTLVDSQVGIVSSMIHAFTAGGLPPPPREEILSIVGLSLPVAVARLAARHPQAAVDRIVEAYKTAFYELRTGVMHQEPLFPGADATIATLSARADILLGVVTGKGRRGLDAVLSTHGLAARFAILKTADDGPSKPHPQLVLDAIAETGAVAARTVVVGDTTYDIEMAKAAGCHAIGVTWGYHEASRLVRAGADRMVDRYADVIAAIDDLTGA